MDILGWLIVGLLVTLIVLELLGMYRCWPPRLKSRVEIDVTRLTYGGGVSADEVAAAVTAGRAQAEAHIRRLMAEGRL